ncbi:hypothetical protein [Ruminiclostridium josui]|uniref:hypothetical protein n=1 Tax=Ruminiclostridium josui TaxID=1499 RepID=UPI000AB7BFE7|nr:hypothetical protein [Ruminiclostridium josui]
MPYWNKLSQGGGGGGSTADNPNCTFVDNVDNRISITGGGGGTVAKSKLSNGEVILVVG